MTELKETAALTFYLGGGAIALICMPFDGGCGLFLWGIFAFAPAMIYCLFTGGAGY